MLAPGALILCSGNGPASLGCFAFRHSRKNELYGVIAAHAATLQNPVSFGDGDVFGVVTEIHKKLDTALVTIGRAVNAGLREDNFSVVDFKAPLTGVFPFSNYWKLIEGSRTQRQEQWWANNVRIPVRHSGFKSNRVDPPALQKKGGERGAVAFGTKQANMVTMRERTSRAGDSGGPVFTPAHQLVGFISMGGGKTDSRQTSIVVAERVFAELGLTLATWQNRDAWQATPPPASTAPPASSSSSPSASSSSSSDDDPFAGVSLATW